MDGSKPRSPGNGGDPLTLEDLAKFQGDIERYPSIHPRVIFSPGVKYLADQAEAHWLIDAIASYYFTPAMEAATKKDPRLEGLHFWRLDVNKVERRGTLSARADSEVDPFIVQDIGYTDFPTESVRIWAGYDGRFWVLYLPSEH